MKRNQKVYSKAPYKNKLGFYVGVPSIALAGRWLEKAGFQIGEKIQVTVSENRIIIEKSETLLK